MLNANKDEQQEADAATGTTGNKCFKEARSADDRPLDFSEFLQMNAVSSETHEFLTPRTVANTNANRSGGQIHLLHHDMTSNNNLTYIGDHYEDAKNATDMPNSMRSDNMAQMDSFLKARLTSSMQKKQSSGPGYGCGYFRRDSFLGPTKFFRGGGSMFLHPVLAEGEEASDVSSEGPPPGAGKRTILDLGLEIGGNKGGNKGGKKKGNKRRGFQDDVAEESGEDEGDYDEDDEDGSDMEQDEDANGGADEQDAWAKLSCALQEREAREGGELPSAAALQHDLGLHRSKTNEKQVRLPALEKTSTTNPPTHTTPEAEHHDNATTSTSMPDHGKNKLLRSGTTARLGGAPPQRTSKSDAANRVSGAWEMFIQQRYPELHARFLRRTGSSSRRSCSAPTEIMQLIKRNPRNDGTGSGSSSMGRFSAGTRVNMKKPKREPIPASSITLFSAPKKSDTEFCRKLEESSSLMALQLAQIAVRSDKVKAHMQKRKRRARQSAAGIALIPQREKYRNQMLASTSWTSKMTMGGPLFASEREQQHQQLRPGTSMGRGRNGNNSTSGRAAGGSCVARRTAPPGQRINIKRHRSSTQAEADAQPPLGVQLPVEQHPGYRCATAPAVVRASSNQPDHGVGPPDILSHNGLHGEHCFLPDEPQLARLFGSSARLPAMEARFRRNRETEVHHFPSRNVNSRADHHSHTKNCIKRGQLASNKNSSTTSGTTTSTGIAEKLEHDDHYKNNHDVDVHLWAMGDEQDLQEDEEAATTPDVAKILRQITQHYIERREAVAASVVKAAELELQREEAGEAKSSKQNNNLNQDMINNVNPSKRTVLSSSSNNVKKTDLLTKKSESIVAAIKGHVEKRTPTAVLRQELVRISDPTYWAAQEKKLLIELEAKTQRIGELHNDLIAAVVSSVQLEIRRNDLGEKIEEVEEPTKKSVQHNHHVDVVKNIIPSTSSTSGAEASSVLKELDASTRTSTTSRHPPKIDASTTVEILATVASTNTVASPKSPGAPSSPKGGGKLGLAALKKAVNKVKAVNKLKEPFNTSGGSSTTGDQNRATAGSSSSTADAKNLDEMGDNYSAWNNTTATSSTTTPSNGNGTTTSSHDPTTTFLSSNTWWKLVQQGSPWRKPRHDEGGFSPGSASASASVGYGKSSGAAMLLPPNSPAPAKKFGKFFPYLSGAEDPDVTRNKQRLEASLEQKRKSDIVSLRGGGGIL
ncbi:unnamed protein product [Amoebophrya sp. A25]|nr:unnamed protein product [Amoebophrya sp. A25]|eukprot:GSA25T00008601001.1